MTADIGWLSTDWSLNSSATGVMKDWLGVLLQNVASVESPCAECVRGCGVDDIYSSNHCWGDCPSIGQADPGVRIRLHSPSPELINVVSWVRELIHVGSSKAVSAGPLNRIRHSRVGIFDPSVCTDGY